MFTHFISLPLATHSKLQDEVKGFQASVVSKIKQKKLIKNLIISVCFGIKFLFPFDIPFFLYWTDMGFHESLLVSPSKLHLTVVMLNLKDVKDLDKAKRVLKVIISFPCVKRYCMLLLLLLGLPLMIECLFFCFMKIRIFLKM